MKQVTLATLRANSRLFADLRGADSASGFVDDGDLDRLINLALTELYDLLVSARGQEHYETVDEITTAADDATVDLPSDFYQLLSLHAHWGSEREELHALSSVKDAHRLRDAGWAQNTPKKYRIRGSVVELFPTPTAATDIDIRYIPVCPTLSEDTPGTTDVFDGVNGWDELVALKVAISLKSINRESPGELLNLYQLARGRIEELAAQRDANTPTRIRDVSPDMPDDPWPFGHGWPS